jgi:site-specific DNA-cytosine methylase
MQTIAFCEIDPYCRKVLAKHWPEAPIHHDVKQLDGSQYVGAVDVICRGYPCQPFSTAGKQLGESDPRHLWPEMRRIIQQARPRWIIAENVVGHITNGLDDVLDEVEKLNYATWPFLIPSRAVASQIKRQRLWIMGRYRNWTPRAFHSLSTGHRSAAQQEGSGCTQEQTASLRLRSANVRQSEGQGELAQHGHHPTRQTPWNWKTGNSPVPEHVEIILAEERQARKSAS